MEIKINAINLKSVDYKDNDKMLTLYSPEKGIVGAGIRGVKKAGAKLAFAAQPFCFAEYVLNVNGERMTITGATEIESFYDLRKNLGSYYGACCISEFLLKCADESGDERLFFLSLDAIKTLNFGKENAKKIVGKYLVDSLDVLGYKLTLGRCLNCKKEDFGGEYSYFDFEKGEIYCEDCGDAGATRILTITANALNNLVLNKPSDESGLNYALKFLNYYIERKIGISLKCIPQLLAF